MENVSTAVLFSEDGVHFLVEKPGKEVVEKDDYLVWSKPEIYMVGGGLLANVQIMVGITRKMAGYIHCDAKEVKLEPLAQAVFNEMMLYKDWGAAPKAEVALFTKDEGKIISPWDDIDGFEQGIALGPLAPDAYGVIDSVKGRCSSEEAHRTLEQILKSWREGHGFHGEIFNLVE